MKTRRKGAKLSERGRREHCDKGQGRFLSISVKVEEGLNSPVYQGTKFSLTQQGKVPYIAGKIHWLQREFISEWLKKGMCRGQRG